MAKKYWFFGKNILLTGASSGIGFYLAKHLACKCGCNVYGIGRTESKLIHAKKQIDEHIENLSKKSKKQLTGSFSYYLLDVSDYDGWKGLKEKLDKANIKIDLVINNAGIMPRFERFDRQNIELLENVMKTNFYSHIYSYETFLNDLKSVKGGIVNIASSASLCPVVGTAVYSASKGAVKNFTECLIEEHKREIYVSLVCPGFALTELFRNEEELGKLVKTFAMSAEKMALKIIKGLRKKKKRMVIGKDAHLMSGMYRFNARFATRTVAGVLKISKDKMFDRVFDYKK